MSKHKTDFKFVASSAIKALGLAFIVTMVLGLLLGYRVILVNGGSSEPFIHYKSLIITAPCKLQNLQVGDFVTWSGSSKKFLSNESYVTHQVIAIKTDGTYFEKGEEFEAVFDGVKKTMIFGKDFNENGECVKDVNVPENCNIILMQRVKGEAKLNSTKDYKNYETNFCGKVIFHSLPLGLNIFALKQTPIITFGLISCLVLVFVFKEQFDIKPIM